MTNQTPNQSPVLNAGRALFRLLASYGFAVVILSFMLVLTLLGTLEQVDHGLYAVQKKYFDSVFLVHDLFGKVPVPLPGAYLLMSLLFVNLVCGGIVRAPKNRKRPGMLVAHAGILLLLVGGFVAHHYSKSGSLQLYEGQSGSVFTSYYDWVIRIRRHDADGNATVYQIPTRQLKALKPAQAKRFSNPDLPFDLEVAGYAMNSRPVPARGPGASAAADGFVLESLSKDPEGERNVAGAYITVIPKGGGEAHRGIVWGLERKALPVELDDGMWSFAMSRREWALPFTIVLDKFTMEKHPNTEIAKVFLSDVTKIEGVSREKLKITMNEPFRYKGYTLFQASWGPQNAAPGTQLFSGFAVVNNPTDHWPLYSCIVVSLGMLIHLFQRLTKHLRRRRTV